MDLTEIRIKGRNVYAPSVTVFGRTVIATGSWVRTARLHDEELLQGDGITEPEKFIIDVKKSGLKADVFTFAQKPHEKPKHPYHFNWDNWAAAPTTCFKDWWDNLPQESRKNARRASKRGVTVNTVPFSDNLVRGIQGIYNETPVRQGKPFWHFGKSFDAVKHENATYLERSEFVGAFLGEELIGFIKFINVDSIAVLIQILAKNEHQDKRPMNALLAHTVELCERKSLSLLIYGKYTYGTKRDNSLTEFKRRNGFEEIKFPRYSVPLSLKGMLAIRSGLHRGFANFVPRPATDLFLKVRSRFCQSWFESRRAQAQEN
jgi:hypothetical protein